MKCEKCGSSDVVASTIGGLENLAKAAFGEFLEGMEMKDWASLASVLVFYGRDQKVTQCRECFNIVLV